MKAIDTEKIIYKFESEKHFTDGIHSMFKIINLIYEYLCKIKNIISKENGRLVKLYCANFYKPKNIY